MLHKEQSIPLQQLFFNPDQRKAINCLMQGKIKPEEIMANLGKGATYGQAKELCPAVAKKLKERYIPYYRNNMTKLRIIKLLTHYKLTPNINNIPHPNLPELACHFFTPAQNEAIALYSEGLDVSEIATIMDDSASTIFKLMEQATCTVYGYPEEYREGNISKGAKTNSYTKLAIAYMRSTSALSYPQCQPDIPLFAMPIDTQYYIYNAFLRSQILERI